MEARDIKKEIEGATKSVLENLQDVPDNLLSKLNRASWSEIKIRQRIERKIAEAKENGTNKIPGGSN